MGTELKRRRKWIYPTFTKKLTCLLISGEGGAGKTSLACQIGTWAMAEEPERRLAAHLMLPVLIEQELDFNEYASTREIG